MFPLSHFKVFTEANTVINFVQYLLNNLKNKNIPDSVDAIHIIINGSAPSGLSQDILLLHSLLNHPERFIKDLDAQTRDKIHIEIKGMLENFIAEQNTSGMTMTVKSS